MTTKTLFLLTSSPRLIRWDLTVVVDAIVIIGSVAECSRPRVASLIRRLRLWGAASSHGKTSRPPLVSLSAVCLEIWSRGVLGKEGVGASLSPLA